MTNEERSRLMRQLTIEVVETYHTIGGINRIGEKNLPSHSDIVALLEELLAVIFPGYHGEPVPRDADLEILVGSRLDTLYRHLSQIIENTLRFSRQTGCHCTDLWQELGDDPQDKTLKAAARKLTLDYLKQLPEIRCTVDLDVRAAFVGDPAAPNTDEIILCYPGVQAIAVHRLAHPLHLMGVPLLPRIMNEWAHHRTGVDIHPGANIGQRFFIDHGTGVVIGETTDIGERVKIYQGVTLGALSFPRNADGSLVKGGKRHPTIGNNVTIYANSTILGGDTVVGDDAVVAGGSWVTRSVPAGGRPKFP